MGSEYILQGVWAHYVTYLPFDMYLVIRMNWVTRSNP